MAEAPRSLLMQAALRLQHRLEASGQPFCIIGGIAIQRWGEPRVTRDVDAMVFTDLAEENALIDDLLRAFGARQENAATFAKESRVLLMVDQETQTGLDVSLGAFHFEKGVAARSSLAEYERGVFLRTCSAEDLIVYKAFANREIDWHDIKGILIRQQGGIDFELIDRELTPLVELKEEPQIIEHWSQLRELYS